MKSTNEQLKNRGFVFDNDILLYKNYKENELLKLLQDKNAYKRTISIKLLSENPKEKYIPLFCEMLKSKEKLYTKLELQNSLKNYGEKAIPYLIPLLGTIGNNQHKKAEIIDINKKSYPCPRDIVGMILIRIGPKVFPELKTLLADDKNIKQIHEAIDIIGHITWNFKDYSMEKVLLEYYNKHKDNEFITWKIIRAFQSFNSKEVKDILENLIRTDNNKIITEEAKRSINRIENRV
jgi:HEAT repeat protein